MAARKSLNESAYRARKFKMLIDFVPFSGLIPSEDAPINVDSPHTVVYFDYAQSEICTKGFPTLDEAIVYLLQLPNPEDARVFKGEMVQVKVLSVQTADINGKYFDGLNKERGIKNER